MRPQLVVDRMISELASDSELIDKYLIKRLQREHEHFPALPATTPETWIVAKRRLDNYLQAWRTDLFHISDVHRRRFDQLQEITDEISRIKWRADKALEWLHETKHTPEVRLKLLLRWTGDLDYGKGSPDVLLYRETRRLYKFSLEKDWIDNMDGLVEPLSQSQLDKRSRDFRRYVDRLRRELDEEVSFQERARGQRPRSGYY